MADRVKVFISSTFDDLRLEREYLEILCENMGLQPMSYPEHSIAGESTSSYMKHLRQSHILVYLITRESKYVETEISTAEDYGIPIIELAELQSDPGNTRMEITDRARKRRSVVSTFQGQFRGLNDLRREVQNGLAGVLGRRFTSPLRLRPFGDEAYEFASTGLVEAHFRAGTAQQTSSLILGPRSGRELQEGVFLSRIHDAIVDVADDSRRLSLLHVFDAAETLDALNHHQERYPEAADAVAWLMSHRAALEAEHVTVAPIEGPLTPAIVHDNTVQLAVLQKRRYHASLEEVGGLAKDLWDILSLQARRPVPLDEYLTDCQLALKGSA